MSYLRLCLYLLIIDGDMQIILIGVTLTDRLFVCCKY